MTSPSLIFDFDGTLADSMHEAWAAFNAVAEELGMPALATQDLHRFRALGPREAMHALEVPAWKLPRIMAAVRSEMHRRVQNLQPFEGVVETLRALWERGIKMAIVSSNSRENISHFLARHDIDRFEVLSCGVGLFGKAARLRRVVRRPAFVGSRAYYVGDEVRDVLAAEQAGIASVAVSWGFAERSALEAHAPTHLLDHPAQLLELLRVE